MWKSVYYTKEYTVGFKRADYDIPKQSWNFFGSQPGHSNCIVEFVGQLGEYNTFAVCSNSGNQSDTTIY